MLRFISGVVWFSLCLTQSALAQSSVTYGDNKAAGHFYSVRGIKMYCEIYGSGKPLLMIHGNGGSIINFEKNIPYFAKKYRVIVPDSRSQGKTVDRKDSLSFEMMADDFAALLDTLKIDSAYVIGWSDGGINALLLAMRHPEKVIRLASTGANLWPDSTAISAALWKDENEQFKRYSEDAVLAKQQKNERKLFMLDWTQPHISLSALHKIQCPSLIICGDHDLIRVQHTLLIARNIPKSYLWVIPDSGHATLVEHADEFNRRVDDFFSKPFHKRSQ